MAVQSQGIALSPYLLNYMRSMGLPTSPPLGGSISRTVGAVG